MTRASRRAAVLGLVAALTFTAGPRCSGGSDGIVFATARLVTASSTVAPLTPFTVDVLVQSETPVYAFDVAVDWDASRLFAYDASEHPDFDDDGSLLLTPVLDGVKGRFTRIVDLRHGGGGATGSFRVATLSFVAGGVPGPTTISIQSLGLGFGDGSEPQVVALPLDVTVGP